LGLGLEAAVHLEEGLPHHGGEGHLGGFAGGAEPPVELAQPGGFQPGRGDRAHVEGLPHFGPPAADVALAFPGAALAGPRGQNAKLLFWFVLVAELNDVLQYVWGKTLGRRPIAPHVSPNKTVEGFVGGTLSTVGVGAALWWATPFNPWQAAGMALAVALLGFAGGLVMSAIKRDRGVKDFGTLIEGHGGVLDRIDSLCFAAPVFFHLTRFYFGG